MFWYNPGIPQANPTTNRMKKNNNEYDVFDLLAQPRDTACQPGHKPINTKAKYVSRW